jgi:hydrogenase expression/formation protein HypC
MSALDRYGTCALDQDGCTTCGDRGIAVRVVAVDWPTALCEDRTGRQAEVAVDFLPGVRPGDVLLVHMGAGIARVREPEGASPGDA